MSSKRYKTMKLVMFLCENPFFSGGGELFAEIRLKYMYKVDILKIVYVVFERRTL